MDAIAAAALADKAAILNIAYAVFGLFVIFGAFALLVAFGERAIGFDLRGFINNVEAVADRAAHGMSGGTVMPGVYLLLGFLAVLGLDLFLALR